MAFNVYQGGDESDAVRWIYDGLPIVTANTDIGSHTNHVYLCKVYYWKVSNWAFLGTLQSRGNKLNYGVFDIQSIALAGNPYSVGALQTMFTNSTFTDDDVPITYAGREWYIRAELGWQSDTQSATYPTNRYYRVIPGSLSSPFLSVGQTNPRENIFRTNTGQFMSVRPKQNNVIHVDVMPDDRYSATFIPSQRRSGVTDMYWQSDLTNFQVTIFYEGGTTVADFAVQRESVSAIQAPTTPQTANGLLLREIHFGPKDILDLRPEAGQSNQIYPYGARIVVAQNTWTRIEVRPETAGGVAIGNGAKYVLHNASKKNENLCQEQIQLKFRNRLGGFDYVSTTMYVKRKMNVTREKYTSSETNFDAANNVVNYETNPVHTFATKSNATLVNDVYTVSTGYIDDDENIVVSELLQSNEVYARHWSNNEVGQTQKEGNFYPCVIASTDMSYMYKETDKLVEYQFDIEFSRKPRPLV